MNENTKNAGLVGLGYVLGRTKKGGLALRTFMWATGSTGGPQTIRYVKGAVGSEQAQALLSQVSGPLRQAVTEMLMAQATARMNGLTQGLTDRTSKLTGTIEGTATDVTDTVGDTAEGVTDTATEATGSVFSKLRKKKAEQVDDESTEEEGEEPEPEQDDDGEAEGEDEEPEQAEPEQKQRSPKPPRTRRGTSHA